MASPLAEGALAAKALGLGCVGFAACVGAAAVTEKQLKKPKSVTVDANGDKARKNHEGEVFEITQSTVSLPMATPPLTGDALDISRKAQALVFEPAGGAPRGGVVFLHGFSQRPKNYITTLRSVAASGFKVVAPTTWLLDIVWPWVSVADAPWFSPPGKLQTAIIVDGLRAMEALRSELGPKAPVSLMGHSMGGACAVVIPSLTTADIASIFVESPAADASTVTKLNPYLSSDATEYPKLFDAYASKPKLALVSAKNDYVVKASSVKDIYDASAPRVPSALVALQTGSHIGFEDKVRVRLPGPLNFKVWNLAFNFLDFFIYRLDALSFLLGDFNTQLSTSKVLASRMNAAYSGGTDLANQVLFDTPVEHWDDVSQLETADKGLEKTLRNPLQGR